MALNAYLNSKLGHKQRSIMAIHALTRLSSLQREARLTFDVPQRKS